jgi:ferritin
MRSMPWLNCVWGLARQIIDKLNLIGEDKGGMYLFDRDLGTMTGQAGGKKGGHGH